MQWLNEFLTAYGRAVTNSGESAWFPFSTYRFYPLYYDLDLKRWGHAQQTAKRKGITPTILAGAVTGPLTIRVELHFALQAGKAANEWETEQAQKAVKFLHEILSARCAPSEDKYGLYSAKIHDSDEIQSLTANTPWYAIDAKRSRKIGNLIMAAIHTAYAYYCDFCYLQWFEVLGPYQLERGRKLIIRRFPNFQPQEIWSGPFASFRSLDIFTIYRDANIVVDQWSHISSKDNLAECLETAAILVDGSWMEPEKWDDLVQELGEVSAALQNQWRALDFEQRKQKVVELRWYMFRDLFNLLGLDWRPTNKMRERVRSRELLPEVTPNFAAVEEAREWWIQFLDPRTQVGLPESYKKPWEK